MVGVLGDRAHVVVTDRQPRAAEPVGVRNRARRTQLVPDLGALAPRRRLSCGRSRWPNRPPAGVRVRSSLTPPGARQSGPAQSPPPRPILSVKLVSPGPQTVMTKPISARGVGWRCDSSGWKMRWRTATTEGTRDGIGWAHAFACVGRPMISSRLTPSTRRLDSARRSGRDRRCDRRWRCLSPHPDDRFDHPHRVLR